MAVNKSALTQLKKLVQQLRTPQNSKPISIANGLRTPQNSKPISIANGLYKELPSEFQNKQPHDIFDFFDSFQNG